eukprot:scaffold7622_cov573-Pinguiococcus_pyrenoidosus.AAC.1
MSMQGSGCMELSAVPAILCLMPFRKQQDLVSFSSSPTYFQARSGAVSSGEGPHALLSCIGNAH